MASIALGAVGAFIGSFAGMPQLGAQLGWAIGSTLGAMLSAPDVNQEGPRLSDLRVMTSSFGSSIVKAYATARVAGNMIWSIPLTEVKKVEDVSGKGGSQTATTYSYYASCAIALCEGPIAGILKIYADGKLVYDVTNPAAGVDSLGQIDTTKKGFVSILSSLSEKMIASSDISAHMTVYLGDQEQQKNGLIESHEGTENTSAYRGTAYVVFDMLPIQKYGNRMPNLEFVIAERGEIGAGESAMYGAVPVKPSTNALQRQNYPAPNYASDMNFQGNSPFLSQDLQQLTYVRLEDSIAIQNGYTTPIEIWSLTPGHEPVKKHTNFVVGQALQRWKGDVAGFCFYQYDSHSHLGSYYCYDAGNVLTSDTAGFLGMLTMPNLMTNGSDIGTVAKSGTHFAVGGQSAKVYVFDGAGTVPVTIDLAVNSIVRDLQIEDGLLYVFYTRTDDNQRSATVAVYDIYNPLSGAVHEIQMAADEFTVGLNDLLYSVALMFVKSGSVHILARKNLPNGKSEDCIRSCNIQNGDTEFADPITFVPPTGWNTPFGAGMRTSFFCDGTTAITPVVKPFVLGDTVAGYEGFMTVNLKMIIPGVATVGEIVKDRCLLAGVPESDIDVSQLNEPIDGYIIASRMSARASIQPVQSFGFFDGVESDGVLKFVKRGGAAVVHIPQSDLGAAENVDPNADLLAITRIQELDLPLEVSIAYADSDASYAIGSQYDRRTTTSSNKKSSLQMPISMTADKARQIASVILYAAWTGRMNFAFSLTRKYARLEPSDVITVEHKGEIYTMRILQIDASGPMIKVSAQSEDASVYTQTPKGAPMLPGAGMMLLPGVTNLFLLDIPSIRDSDGEVFYAGVSGNGAGWHGATLFESEITTVDYKEITSAKFFDPVTSGTTVSALGDYSGIGSIDAVNFVDVEMNFGGQMSSVQIDALLNGANMMVIGKELVQARDAVLIGGSQDRPQFRLSGLLRGRKGTEMHMATHTTGEAVVVLNSRGLQVIDVDKALLGLTRDYKAVSNGRNLPSTSKETFKATGVSVKPYAPVHIAAGRTSAAGDISIIWTRRDRRDQNWRDYGDVAMSESAMLFDVEIVVGNSILRTISGVSQTSCDYTIAQQIADFGTKATTFGVVVYQLSEVVGRGFPGSQVIHL